MGCTASNVPKQFFDYLQSIYAFLNILDNREITKEEQRSYAHFLVSNPQINCDVKNEVICSASRYGHVEVVRILCCYSELNPAARNNEAIRIASEKGHLDIVEILMKDPRVDPSVYENIALRYASRNGHTQVVRTLLKDERVNAVASDGTARLSV